MAIRNDFIINWGVSPRVITITKPSTACSMQDLIDTLRYMEAQPDAIDNKPIVDASGKEILDTTNKVGLTVTLQNAQIGFEARTGPDWVQCLLDGGNVVAIDSSGVPIDEVANNAFVNVKTTKSASATLQEQDALQYASYGGVVSVDSSSITEGVDYPSGNMEYPTKYVHDAISIAIDKGFNVIRVIGSYDLVSGDSISGYTIRGESHLNSVLTVHAEAIALGTQYKSFDITGDLDGGSLIEDCVVRDLNYFNGEISNSQFDGRIVLAGNADASFNDCRHYDLNNPPVFDAGESGQDLIMTRYAGQGIIDNLTGSSKFGIGLDTGKIVVNPSCTAGIISITGTGTVVDNSGPGCLVIDSTIDGTELKNLRKVIESLRPHHTGTGNIWFWDPYGGNDAWDGKAADRAFKTWTVAHNAVIDNNHDIIFIVPGDPTGNTTITEAINVTKNYVFVRGPGRDVVTTGLVTTSGNGTEFSKFRVNNAIPGAIGVKSTGSFTLLDNLWFEFCTNGVYMSAHHPLIHSCKFHGMTGYAVKMVGDISHGEIYDCTMGDAGETTIQIDTSVAHGGIKMRDTVVLGSAGYGVELSPTTRKFVSLTGNSIKYNVLGDFNDLGTDNILNSEDNWSTPTGVIAASQF